MGIIQGTWPHVPNYYTNSHSNGVSGQSSNTNMYPSGADRNPSDT